MPNIEQEIREIIAEIIEKKPETITGDANLFEDLGADSMMALEILAALEKKYKVVIPEDKLTQLTSLRKIMELVETLKKKR
ncbi:MAG: acyl carrier protein [Candidatus Omnitrophica bacterium]|nr:acyl carrier protein [Candidatus Omnitrophota bacterium]MDD5352242.1 acyl carrier protein [Candidatus Omnitrophota bacterium]MDD5549840.1 acyl carrier protein [Candidatus Omnitrophota bacterium]